MILSFQTNFTRITEYRACKSQSIFDQRLRHPCYLPTTLAKTVTRSPSRDTPRLYAVQMHALRLTLPRLDGVVPPTCQTFVIHDYILREAVCEMATAAPLLTLKYVAMGSRGETVMIVD
jgi:hypothetical protein